MAGFVCRYIIVLYILTWNSLLFSVHAASEFYQHKAEDIRSNSEVGFKKYEGMVVLIVNVASQCAFTDSNSKALVHLQKKYKEGRFKVLAFPCNQFGNQEPRTNPRIFKFADEKYQINFDLFNKINTIDTILDTAHPLYAWLKTQADNTAPKWNFSKYLLNQNGYVERYASGWVSPVEFEDDIEDLLSGKELSGGILKHENNVNAADKKSDEL